MAEGNSAAAISVRRCLMRCTFTRTLPSVIPKISDISRCDISSRYRPMMVLSEGSSWLMQRISCSMLGSVLVGGSVSSRSKPSGIDRVCSPRFRLRTWVRQVFSAMRYIQVLMAASPRYEPRFSHTRIKISCIRSLRWSALPVYRQQRRNIRSRFCRNSSSKSLFSSPIS